MCPIVSVNDATTRVEAHKVVAALGVAVTGTHAGQ